MCPELSQDVSQDHLSRAFYPETFIYDHHQHSFFFNHGAACAAQYKPPAEHIHDAGGTLGSHPISATVQQMHLQPTRGISVGMIGSENHCQEPYIAPAIETPTDYSLQINCSENPLMPDIDCGWMKDVLDDFLLPSHEMPPLAPLGVPHCSSITLPTLLSPLDLRSKREMPASASSPSNPAQNVTSPRSDVTSMGEQTPGPKSPSKTRSSSPTPEPLRTRASKRQQKEERSRKVSKWAHKATLTNVDQVEHVIRERQRRDDMSYKIATLEGLLPQGPKRDRASIVHDSVQYVKTLQQRVEELTKKSAELQLKRTTNCSSPVVVNKDDVRVLSPEISKKPFRLVTFHVQVEGGGEAASVSNCRCNLDFLSLTMKALEQSQLDLCRSSITKMSDSTFFCVIDSKPCLETSSAISSSSLALKIKSAVEL